MIAIFIGILVVLLALWDGFEVMVLPRRITRRWRLARFYYRVTWKLWRSLCRRLPAGRYRENCAQYIRPAIAFGSVCLLVNGADHRICARPLGRAHAARRLWRESRPMPLSQWRDAVHVGFRRRHTGDLFRQVVVRGRSGHGLRFHGDHHRLLARAVPSLFPPRAEHRAARRPGRLATDRQRAVSTLGAYRREPRYSAISCRVGSLGR